jgi:protein tyrosine/serine phosphatase
MAGRRFEFESIYNFREMGGFPTADGARIREGRVFRSDALHRVGWQDVEVLERLGIATVFDLRSDLELESDGIGEFAGASARHVHVPLVPVTLSPYDPDVDWDNIDLPSRYIEMLEVGGGAIRTVFEGLAAEGASPAVFHCTGGKDRTGVVAALILRELGVADEIIVEDYSRSQSYLASIVEAYRSELERQAIRPDLVAYLTSSPAERMRFTLGELDRRWGSTREYLAAAGVDHSVLESLRKNLVE